MIEDYENARKLGEKSYRHDVIRGRYPYLPALDYILRNRERFKEEKVGLCEIPIALICGTLTKGRQEAFAKNYLDRFFDIGIAEQDLMGTAAGFATCGSETPTASATRSPMRAGTAARSSSSSISAIPESATTCWTL